MAAFRIGSRRDLSYGRRPLRSVRHRAEAARTRQVKMVCSYDRRTCRHGRLGMQSRRRQIQSGACAVFLAVRQCLTPSQVAAGAVRSCSAGHSPAKEHSPRVAPARLFYSGSHDHRFDRSGNWLCDRLRRKGTGLPPPATSIHAQQIFWREAIGRSSCSRRPIRSRRSACRCSC
jgi:hypothetical protein